MSVVPAFMSIYCGLGEQKSIVYPPSLLEMELQMVRATMWALEIKPRSFGGGANAFTPEPLLQPLHNVSWKLTQEMKEVII